MFNNGLPEINMIYFFHNNQNKKVKKYKVNLYIRILIISIIQFFCWSNISGQVIDYSDTGNGIHQNKIQWLTWAGTDLDDGIHNGDSVNFSLPLGGNLEVVFSNVSIAYPIPDPTPGDGESPHGYLPSDVYTWCGATFYTAYDLSSSGSEILFSDIDNSGVVGNGENAQDINFDISFKLIINGNTLPADIIVGDPETTNPGYSETITVSSNRGDWELIENIRGTNYGLSGLNTNVIIISDTETGFGCSGGTSTGTNSSPLLMTTGVAGLKTQLNYDISYPLDLGHEGIVFGIKLPFDQGDAPSSYQIASHLQEMIPTTTGSPDLINNSKLYLGVIPGDPDYHVNNALFSSGANGDNNDNINDEDGLTTINYEQSCDGTILEIPNSEINIVNTTGSTAKIHAWIDFDQNGIFDVGEYAVADVLNGTANPQSDLVFSLPSGFLTGSKYMRLRLSTDSAVDGLAPFGVAVDGEVEDYVVTISDPIVCEEVCNNGIDDDGDGLVDCNDPDCGIVTITNVNVSNCIDHPYADVATLEVTIAWQTNPTEDTIEISILGKTEYINTSTTSSPSTVNFLVPADGVTNNTITARFKEALCSDSDIYNAPFPCSSNELRCNTLFICGDSKGADADAFDHGLMKYIDGINGNAILVGALAKNEVGMGLYDPMDGTTPLVLDIDTFDLILVSATTWGDISNNLKFALDSTSANVLLMNHNILTDLSMATGGWINQTESAYTDDINQIRVYNFNNTNPRWDPIIGIGSYYSDRADAYLWLNENDASNNWNGIFFHYEASDTLDNVPSNHGSRTFLGYMMDGVYWNLSTNMGVTPVPEAEWFDPIRHLTLEGKYYLDQAISLAAINCTPEICDNGIDDDGDGVTDCFDSDCIPEANPTLLTTCDNSNGTGTGVFILHDANPTVSTESGVDISYYPTLSDAQNNINVLISPHTSVNATIYARVQRGTTGCFNTSVVTLNVGAICIENCANGIDDDGNGLIDCADSECPCCESDPPTLIKIIKKDP